MNVYTFFKHDDSERPPSFDLVELESLAAARVYALGILAARPHYRRVEISDGRGDPAVVERADV